MASQAEAIQRASLDVTRILQDLAPSQDRVAAGQAQLLEQVTQLAGAQFGQVMGYEKPMYFKAKKPQSLDMGLMGIDAAEEAAASQGETLKLPIAKTETFYRPPWF